MLLLHCPALGGGGGALLPGDVPALLGLLLSRLLPAVGGGDDGAGILRVSLRLEEGD